MRGFAQARAGDGPRIGARGRGKRRRLARDRYLRSPRGARLVAAAAPGRATTLRAAPAGVLGHTPAPNAATIGGPHRLSAAAWQTAGECGPHRFGERRGKSIEGVVAAARGQFRDADGGLDRQRDGPELCAQTRRAAAAGIAAQGGLGVRGGAEPRAAYGAPWSVRGRAGAPERAPLLPRTHAAGQPLGSDGRRGTRQSRRAAGGASSRTLT